MATNPTYLGTDVQLSGQNSVNDPRPKTRSTSNKFNTSYPHILTARYGSIYPFYVANAVEKELHPLHSAHDIRADTLQTPKFGDVKMKKSYFEVPLRAIYPLNYDLMRVPPVEGDDINDLRYPNKAIIPGTFFHNLKNYLLNLVSVDSNYFVQIIFFLEKFFSRSSLFDSLGCHLSSTFTVNYYPSSIAGEQYKLNIKYNSFDLWFEAICDRLFCGRVDEVHGSSKYYLVATDKSTRERYAPLGTANTDIGSVTEVSIHYLLELIRDNPLRFTYAIRSTGDDDIDEFQDLRYLLNGINIRWQESTDLNIERLIAYQLVCAEYFTDDHIDDIFSTDKFRNMMRSYFNYQVDGSSYGFFELNGVSYPYDVFSSVVWYLFADSILTGYLFEDSSALSYIYLLLTRRHSLRFEDYFVGGRLNPLAVGDTKVPVINSGVDAYEMARAQVFTRFLNSVNLSGPEFDNYSKDILDNDAPPRTDVPKFLAMTMSTVGSYEVENTSSDNQGKLVTNLRSSDERFAFNITLDHESIILGLVSFESRRYYSKTVDRFFYHKDRYDSFNPMLQHMGDQNISRAELRAGHLVEENFAYGVADGEYKQRVGVVSGGVVDFLPSWAMVTDVVDSYDDDEFLNSSYIRSKDVEFDRFFANLSNNSDAGYFHFIIEFNNMTEPVKPMVVAPEILL